MGQLIPVITGPTASGKSDAAVLLARTWGTEIVSADSRQVYKYLDIGTAKPGKAILQEVKHHFVDYLEPDEVFSAGRFEQEGRRVCRDLLKEGKMPLVCGGTGLYIQSLREGIIPVEADEGYRKFLKELFEKYGAEGLHTELRKTDPVAAEKIPSATYKRVARALEVMHVTGESILRQMENQKKHDDLSFIIYCLMPEREYLYSRINKRAAEMVETGLIAETEMLFRRYPERVNSLNTVGYKETISYLKGEIDKDEMLRLIQRNTRHFAKRQFTWFRSMEEVHYIQTSACYDSELIAQYIADDFNERLQNET